MNGRALPFDSREMKAFSSYVRWLSTGIPDGAKLMAAGTLNVNEPGRAAATAHEAGYRVKFLPIQEIGWDAASHTFVDLDQQPIRFLFKLYPWEWIMREDFGGNVKPSGALFLEPMWKMLLSNKGILPILWDMYPHENLLPAYRDPAPLAGGPGVRKPTLGREGANIRITDGNRTVIETDGAYGDGDYIFQAFAEAPSVLPNCHRVAIGSPNHRGETRSHDRTRHRIQPRTQSPQADRRRGRRGRGRDGGVPHWDRTG